MHFGVCVCVWCMQVHTWALISLFVLQAYFQVQYWDTWYGLSLSKMQFGLPLKKKHYTGIAPQNKVLWSRYEILSTIFNNVYFFNITLTHSHNLII